MIKHIILFLAAKPLGIDRLALHREAHAIQAELERSGHGDQFELVTCWVAQPLDLLRELRRLKPSVVHFSGHAGAQRGELDRGLFFEGLDGRAQLVSTSALRDTFRAAGSSVKLLVLNACYSEPQAAAMASHVDCVVGMDGSFSDAAARSFAIGFYGGLAARESIAVAYHQGCAAIGLEGEAEADRPRLRVRSGVDATQLVLAAESQASLASTAPRPQRRPVPGAAASCSRWRRWARNRHANLRLPKRRRQARRPL